MNFRNGVLGIYLLHGGITCLGPSATFGCNTTPQPTPTPAPTPSPSPTLAPSTACVQACNALATAGCKEGSNPFCAAALSNAVLTQPNGQPLTCSVLATVKTASDIIHLGQPCTQ
jgi:hypothetical protein